MTRPVGYTLGVLKSVVDRIKRKPQFKTIARNHTLLRYHRFHVLQRSFSSSFYAKYVDRQASIRIVDGHVIDGNFGARALHLVEEWRILHKAELLDDWTIEQARQPLVKIEPIV